MTSFKNTSHKVYEQRRNGTREIQTGSAHVSATRILKDRYLVVEPVALRASLKQSQD